MNRLLYRGDASSGRDSDPRQFKPEPRYDASAGSALVDRVHTDLNLLMKHFQQQDAACGPRCTLRRPFQAS